MRARDLGPRRDLDGEPLRLGDERRVLGGQHPRGAVQQRRAGVEVALAEPRHGPGQQRTVAAERRVGEQAQAQAEQALVRPRVAGLAAEWRLELVVDG